MPVCYLQGGDTYQKLDHPIWAGQTFTPLVPFTLQWIDLNLKLSGRQPEARVTVWHAGEDHLPSGDVLSLSSYWLINQPHPARDWLWFEPWGKTLDENHYWLDQPPGSPPDISLKNGAITLVNTGETAQWVDTLLSTTPFPLVDSSGRHLYFHHYSPKSSGHPVNHWHSYTFKTEKNGDLWTLEGVISHGTLWPPMDTTCGITPLGSSFYCGQGPQVFDFTEWWIHCRNCLELDPDPTGWVLHHLQLRVEDTEAAPGGTLQNNFCGISREPYTPVPFDDYNVLPTGYSLPNRLYRVRFKMKEVLLEADSYYFIRVCVFPSLLESAHYWQYDKGDASYPGGIRLSSADGGSSWDKHFDDDHLFAAFGTPTVPAPPPEPPIINWTALEVEQIITATGIKFILTTNVPCHLYMLWTDIEPQLHERTRIVRGLSVPAPSAYCFVVWNQNDQEEPGDTIIHTFIKEPWAVCETRWFTFRALVNNDWSPSSCPIFTKHRLYAPVPIEVTLYPDPHPEVTTVDGYASRLTTGTWLELHDGLGTGASHSASQLFIRIKASSIANRWTYLQRTIILFDPTEIPEGSTILSAFLGLYVIAWDKTLPDPHTINVYQSFPVNNTVLELADYQNLYTVPLSQPKLISDMPEPNNWIEFELNEAGLALIVPPAIIKLGIREGAADAPNISPTWSSSKLARVVFNSADAIGEFSPYLRVNYLV